MSYLSFQTCVTCHGTTTEDLFTGLLSQLSIPRNTDNNKIPFLKAKLFDDEKNYVARTHKLIGEQLSQLQQTIKFGENKTWGIILASTKGGIEENVWGEAPPTQDPYHDTLNFLEREFPYHVERSIVVSNACTSSHGAVELGQRWLKRKVVDHVYILAFDLVGPFTLKGFKSLRALSEQEVVRPFDIQRDGLVLGDGIGSLVLSATPQSENDFYISEVKTLCEGVAATRPDISGKNLATCFKNSLIEDTQVVLAHGTGTFYNDLTESKAIALAFAKSSPPWVTCSKWSVGHTLGASGLIDICLATEILKQQIIPGIATLQESDLEISENLLSKNKEARVNQILISSLGFGGMCSALSIRRGDT